MNLDMELEELEEAIDVFKDEVTRLTGEYKVGSPEYSALITMGMCLQNVYLQNINLKKQVALLKEMVVLVAASNNTQ